MKFIYYDFTNKEYLSQIKNLICPLKKYFPWWCETVSIYSQTNIDNVAAIVTEPQYRRIKLYIYPNIVDELPKEQKRIILHEIGHATIAPLINLIDFSILPFINNEQLRGFIVGEVTKLNEACAEDIALILEKINA